MDATGQIFQVSKFPNTLLFAIIPGMFRQNRTKIGQIYMPYKLAQSGCNPLKIKSEIKVHKQLTPHQEIAHLLKPQINGTMGQWDLLVSMTMDQDFLTSMMMGQDFLGKVTHCRHVKRTTQYWAKLPKPKAKPVAKMEKPQNVLRSKTTNWQTVSKLWSEPIVNVFVSGLVLA